MECVITGLVYLHCSKGHSEVMAAYYIYVGSHLLGRGYTEDIITGTRGISEVWVLLKFQLS